MRLIAATLLLATLAQLAPAQTLTDAEILDRMDDATASEVRWLLATNRFCPYYEEDGGWYRERIAFTRLLTHGDVEVFRLLASSNRDTTAAYGVQGLFKLKSDEIVGLLPKLVTRRELIEMFSGVTSSFTSLSELCLYRVSAAALSVPAETLNSTWDAWLLSIAELAVPIDPFVLSRLTKLFGTDPLDRAESAIEPQRSVMLYLRTWRDSDQLGALIRLAKDKDATQLTRDLALDHLAWMAAIRRSRFGLPKPPEYEESEKRIEEEGVAEQIALHSWQRNVKWLTDGDPRWWKSPFSERFMPLPEASGLRSLRKSKDDAIRAAAEEAWNSDLCAAELQSELPGEPMAAYIWLTRRIEEASYDAKARKLIWSLLIEKGSELTWTPYGNDPSSFANALVRHTSAPNVKTLTSATLELAKSDSLENRMLAMHILSRLIKRDVAKEYALKVSGLKETVLSGLADAEQMTSWADRLLVLKLAESLEEWSEEIAQRHDLVRTNSMNALAVDLATKPRMLPPFMYFWVNRLDTTSRHFALLATIFAGSTSFVPAGEQTPDDTEPSLDDIYKRMKEAAAKLEK